MKMKAPLKRGTVLLFVCRRGFPKSPLEKENGSAFLCGQRGFFENSFPLLRENDALFSLPKRKKFQKRSWQTCGLIAFACGSRIEQSPINSLKCEPTSRHTIFEPKPRRVSDVYAVLCPRAVRVGAFLTVRRRDGFFPREGFVPTE